MVVLRVIFFVLVGSVLFSCQNMPNKLSQNPKEKVELYQKAISLYQEKKWDEAKKSLESLIQLAPADAKIWFKLGNIYARENQLGKARDCYFNSLKYDDKDAKTWHNLAVVQLRQATLSLVKVKQLSIPESRLYIRADHIIELYQEAQAIGKK